MYFLESTLVFQVHLNLSMTEYMIEFVELLLLATDQRLFVCISHKELVSFQHLVYSANNVKNTNRT
jgi:hypothetical protein